MKVAIECWDSDLNCVINISLDTWNNLVKEAIENNYPIDSSTVNEEILDDILNNEKSIEVSLEEFNKIEHRIYMV